MDYYDFTYFSALHIDGLVQERHNSIANALELRLSCINPWIIMISFTLEHYISMA